jgi:hypothetical protein
VIEALTTLIGGLGGTILLLMPGYVLGKVYSRGVRGPELSEQIFIATTAIGGVLTHALMLWWTILLLGDLRRAIDAGSSAALVSLYPLILGWVFVVLFLLPAFLGGLAARITDTRDGRLLSIVEWFGLSTSKRTAEAWTWIWGELSRSGEGTLMKRANRSGLIFQTEVFGFRVMRSLQLSSTPNLRRREWQLSSDPVGASNLPLRGMSLVGLQVRARDIKAERSTRLVPQPFPRTLGRPRTTSS